MKYKTKRKIKNVKKKVFNNLRPFSLKENNAVRRLYLKLFGNKEIYNHLIVPDCCFKENKSKKLILK